MSSAHLLGREPVLHVGRYQSTFCKVRVPAPLEPSDAAGAEAGTGAADARKSERLVRWCPEPREPIPRGMARQLHLLMCANLRPRRLVERLH